MIEVTDKNGLLICKFTDTDRFNATVSEKIKEKLLAYFNKPNVKLILDMTGIKFVDSSGFSVFLSIMKAANNNFGEFKICNIDSEVKELFQVLQLHNVFEIYNDQAECIKSFE